MKYVYQIGIISVISFVAEMLYVFLPLPVPASVYGLLILLFLLMTKIIKPEQIEDVADWLLKIMPILFVGPSVGLIKSFDVIKGQILPLIIMCVISTIGVMIVTSVVAQAVIRMKNKKNADKQ
ncbi:MAG: CidA/LrgA family protein [Lachnospiraceae bacterium]|nr:CidA/LrgA family protein [Lachnospiraceae bacterium]